jgi:hypothetical protein
MTEAEWGRCGDLTKMMGQVDPCRFDRKFRLFAVACCRRVSDRIRDPDAHGLLELIEKLADGAADLESVRAAWEQVSWYPEADGAVKKAAAIDCASWKASTDCYRRAALDAEAAVADAIAGDGFATALENFERRGRERSAQFAILRDIVGNPFRPTTFAPGWRTDTVLSLARQMYESRDFSALPILADALQDAGCESADILDHCRGLGPHVRGCWVVDQVLGKT